MSRTYRIATLAAAAVGLFTASLLAAPATQPLPTLRIVEFKEYHAPGMMGTASLPGTGTSTGSGTASGGQMAPAGGGMMSGGSAAAALAEHSGFVDLGEPFELGWRVEACHMQTVRLALVGVGDLPTGTGMPVSGQSGCLSYSGHRSVTPSATTTYRLQLSGTPLPGAQSAPTPVTATYQLVVRTPQLEVLEPRINDDTLGVTFRVRNTGSADFRPSAINITYSLTGIQRDGALVLEQGTLRVPNVSLERNHSADLGSVTLANRERLFGYDRVSISITLDPNYAAPLPDSHGTFQHTWPTKTSTITADLLRMIGRASSLQVRLNNYSSSAPGCYVRTDSFVRLNLAGSQTNMDFGIPATDVTLTIKGSVTHHTYVQRTYRILVNQITADVHDRDDFLDIRDGKLAIHLEIPNPGSSEIKTGKLEDGHFDDGDVPDVNVGGFPVDVTLTPGVSSDQKHLTVAAVAVTVPPISADLHGILDELIPKIGDALRTAVHDTVEGQLRSLLGRADVKRAFEDGLGQVTTALHIVRIKSLDARGNRITINYL